MGEDQQKAFDALKQAIRENVVVGGDSTQRFYLSVTANTHGFRAIFFQLAEEDERTTNDQYKDTGPTRGNERVIQFISQTFIDAETRYGAVEREYLAILRSLEEVRYQVLQSPYPVVIYTSTSAATLLRKNEDLVGR